MANTRPDSQGSVPAEEHQNASVQQGAGTNCTASLSVILNSAEKGRATQLRKSPYCSVGRRGGEVRRRTLGCGRLLRPATDGQRTVLRTDCRDSVEKSD